MRFLEFGCLITVLCGLLVSLKAEIYIVTVEGEPVISYAGGIDGFEATAVESDEKIDTNSELVTSYAHHLEKKHDMLLGMLFEPGTYKKLYSYRHLINGFAVHISPEQAETLRHAPGVKSIVGAQHFAQAAIAAGAFNPSIDFASPLDGDGHGSHTASIAAGNNGIPVRMHGHEFGRASGMAPRARIAVYKALYRLFGGFVADVVAAIDQAVYDGVDILSLSVGPNSPPAATKTTFLNPFDATLLGAVKAGVFVAQAAGNGGPFPKTMVSYSPWIASVAAAIDDRRYKNHLTLGNGKVLAGIGLSPATHLNETYTLVAANDVLLDSSVMKFTPTDCQRPELLNKRLIQGNILLCGYSFNFVSGSASIKKVSETAKALGAVGFVLCVENASPETRFDPVPVGVPGIVIVDVRNSKVRDLP
ncbi:hypothetical protein PIB30_040518 [Stylosanthes scabra]|uniref:Subtilisin-like protease SBT2.6 n=1 Tax=Stylosanthes scabra TaxID=79078 RepID=A0ABU6RF69_9FABA|nr:hypothetical protein [Stylosanthes scabra]